MMTGFEAGTDFSILQVDGTLQAPVSTELRERVTALLVRGERRIVLDLTRLADIDAGGIGELVNILNMTRAAGAVLRIANATRHVRQLLHATGFSPFLSDESQ
jgi:anti-anti-sigma factor